MPSPSASLATLRPELGASVEAFNLAMDMEGFIGLQVLPVMEVGKESGTFGKIPIEQLLQSPDTQRAPGSAYARGKWRFTSASYTCLENGWEEPVDDREAAMYRDYFDAESVSAARARNFVARALEERVAAMVFNATTFTSQTTNITTEWSDAASVPITDVNTAAKAIWDRCGLWPNALIINRHVFRNLLRVTQIMDGVKYVEGTLPGQLTTSHLSLAFDLPYIIVSGSPKNAAIEGQDVSISPVWSSEYAMVARIALGNDIRQPCLGRTFHWGEDGSDIGATMESYRDETVRGDIVRARMDTDELLITTAAAQLLDNVTA